jgi:hypothetical protein
MAICLGFIADFWDCQVTDSFILPVSIYRYCNSQKVGMKKYENTRILDYNGERHHKAAPN